MCCRWQLGGRILKTDSAVYPCSLRLLFQSLSLQPDATAMSGAGPRSGGCSDTRLELRPDAINCLVKFHVTSLASVAALALNHTASPLAVMMHCTKSP